MSVPVKDVGGEGGFHGFECEVAFDYDVGRPMKSISFADKQTHNENISWSFVSSLSRHASEQIPLTTKYC